MLRKLEHLAMYQRQAQTIITYTELLSINHQLQNTIAKTISGQTDTPMASSPECHHMRPADVAGTAGMSSKSSPSLALMDSLALMELPRLTAPLTPAAAAAC